MRRATRLHAFLAAFLLPAFLAAAPATRYQNTFDDASALDGLETSPGAAGGSVAVENGRLALRGAPFSYRGARVAVPLSLVLGRPGPFTAREIAAARVSWTFNLSHENGAGASANTGFRVYPLSTSASPDTEAAAFYALRGGIFTDDQVLFHRALAPSPDAVPEQLTSLSGLSLAPAAPGQVAFRIDHEPGPYSARWIIRIHRGETAVDPEAIPRQGIQAASYTEYFSNPNAFTHLVLEAQNSGTVWIDNLVVTTYATVNDDIRGPDQIILRPAGTEGPFTFGDAPIPLPALASSGLPITWSASGAGRVEDGVLHFTGTGYVYLYGQQSGDAIFQPTASQFYLNVDPRALTIGLSKLRQTYAGAPLPVGTATTPADAPLRITYNGSETPPRHVGVYNVEVAPASSNYTGAAHGRLVVTPAPLVVRPAPVSRLIGRPNPFPYPLIYDGLLGDDTAASIDKPPVARTSATTSSRAGAYTVSLTGGSDNDYVLSRNSGTLTVLAHSGTYEALLTPPGAPAAPPLGKLTVTVSSARPAFSGTLWLADETFARPFTGSLGDLASDGSIPSSLFLPARMGNPAWHQLEFKVDETSLQATLSRGSDFSSLALLAVSDEGAKRYSPIPKTNSPWTGRHTVLLRPTATTEPNSVPAPRGPGHATADITAASGKLALSGRLPDGTKLSSTTYPGADGRHRLFVRPHGSARPNALVGRLDPVPHPALPGRHYIPAEQQSLFWSRAPIPSPKPATLYPAGYSSLPLSVLLDPWLAPVPAKRATARSPAQPAITLVHRLGIAGDPAALEILYSESSDFGPPKVDLATSIPFSASGKPLAPLENPTRWKLSVNSTRGTLSGSFVLRYPPKPPATKDTYQTVTFSGVLRQPATADDPLAGAAQLIWTDVYNARPPASDEILFARPIPESDPSSAQ